MKNAFHPHRLAEFGVGLLFGIGLILAGMTDPSKVLGFLDLAGLWDPSLAFVMGGAILVSLGAFTLAKKRTTVDGLMPTCRAMSVADSSRPCG